MRPEQKAIRELQLFQSPTTAVTFDETNLISSAGLVPVMRLARRAGLGARVSSKLTVPGGAGFDAAAKVCSIVAGMLTGADSIADLGVLREGAVHKVLPGVKAPPEASPSKPNGVIPVIRNALLLDRNLRGPLPAIDGDGDWGDQVFRLRKLDWPLP